MVDSPSTIFPYSFDDVASVFWDRYPNSFAKHIMSEDVLERKITENTITTKKLIVKKGVVELHLELFTLHERCLYKSVPITIDSLTYPTTDLVRSAFVAVNSGRMSSIYEKVLLMGFKKSTTNTAKGLNEKLEERFGSRLLPSEMQKLEKIKQKLKSSLVTEAKCEE